MKITALCFFSLIVFIGCIYSQETDTSSFVKNKLQYFTYDSLDTLHSVVFSKSVKNFLIKEKRDPDLLSLKNFKSLELSKFYFADEISKTSETTSDDKEKKPQTKYDWLYFAGTALAAVIVYFAWPGKAPESKQTLTFGKPLSPR